MKVLVCGSRKIKDNGPVLRRLALFPRCCTTLISGGAPGVDRSAEEVAKMLHLPIEVFKPDYKRWGRHHAPRERNLRMLDEEPDLVLAFWDGKSTGTKHTIEEAERRGIPVEKIIIQNQ